MNEEINIGILIDDLKNLNDGEIKTIFEILNQVSLMFIQFLK